jgi:hypothetical protein
VLLALSLAAQWEESLAHALSDNDDDYREKTEREAADFRDLRAELMQSWGWKATEIGGHDE